MTASHSEAPDRAQEANRLYWDSSDSVNQIAEELGLSKGSLYGMVEPLPADLPCPSCGAELAFPNRTAREKGFLTCPACGLEEEASTVREAVARGEISTPPRARAAPRAGSGVDGQMLAGTALLGIAVGIVIGTYIRRLR